MKKLQKIAKYLVFSSIAAFLLGGCTAAVTGHQKNLNTFDKQLLENKCEFTEIDKKIEDKNDVILWGIQGGSLARNCQDYNKSVFLFDTAEKAYKEEVDLESGAESVGEGTASILVNNNVNEYEGDVYEKVMVNVYKGLDFLSMGKNDDARVEFNRALDRQRRAKEYFEKEIAEKQEKNKEDKNAKIASNNQTQNTIYQKYADVLDNFEAYPDFVNPFATYMSGLFFLLDGDAAKASDLLKESMLMDSENKQIKADFELAEKVASSGSSKLDKRYAWIIYENGQGMYKDEMKFHIPLFLVTSKAYYTGIALPKIKSREASYTYLNVGEEKTEEVANMDRVIKTEFKKKFPSVVTEAVMSLILKTVAQHQLKENAGLVGGLLGAVYQGLTNRADVRSWTALPKNFQALRVELNEEPLTIFDDMKNQVTSVAVPQESNAIIYVKSDVRGRNIVHKIFF